MNKKLNIISGDYLFAHKDKTRTANPSTEKKARRLHDNVMDWRKTSSGNIAVDRRGLQRKLS